MSDKKIKKAILITIGVVCVFVIFVIFATQYLTPCYKCGSPCASVESDANNIAAAIADYFSIPEHTQIKPGDLDDGYHTENPWTFIQCSDAIYIYVYDIEEDCPIEYQNSYPEWDSHIYTKIIEW
jgi:hypothetical protein